MSPVIGVVLMVAITVILAAVIAAFAFGMAGNIPHTRMLIVTADQIDTTHIIVTYWGGPDHSSLISLNISWPTGKQQNISYPQIGNFYTATGANVTAGKDHILVTGRFSDLTDQVLLDTFV